MKAQFVKSFEFAGRASFALMAVDSFVCVGVGALNQSVY